MMSSSVHFTTHSFARELRRAREIHGGKVRPFGPALQSVYFW